MFYNLTKKISQIIKTISNQGRLTKKNIKKTLREVRKALLEADVALSVIKKLLKNVEKKAIGNIINNTLTPGQEFIKIVKNELINIMGVKNNKLNFSTSPPAIILIIGLQGSGKTTNLIKIGKLLKKKHKKKILAVSTDTKRLSAIKQLKILGKKNNLDIFQSKNKNPIEIAKEAIKYTISKLYDILLIDTSGRMHNNKDMMQELKILQKTVKPIETLFVIDSMTGQDSINIIKNYNKILKISGIILTKMDSNARGGIALSCRYLTKIPIKFISNGEKINCLENFCPISVANKILGMENIFSVINNIESKIKKKKIPKQKKNFDLNDFLKHIKKIKKFDSITNIVNKIPIKQTIQETMIKNFDVNIFKQLEAIIHSMNPKERKNPEIIKGSRKKRISKGSGVPITKINILLKKFFDMKKIMKKINQGGVNNIINQIKKILPNFLF
ncbi:signal recognition particle receptor subunit alpha [Buchnera aphidicola (Mollitrichosiphum nigrofasciatum)]|uniref:signal recognition particle protein n=1 Tax=Buchnera aphidicola TaxID=9 RepID=UPI0031B86DBA